MSPLVILLYHAIVRTPLALPDWCFLSESAFRGQVDYLRQHFDVLPLSEAAARLNRGQLERPTAVLTFDDGFQNSYDVAFPILREAGLPSAYFVSTALIDTSDTIWFCRVNRALARTSLEALDWEGERLALGSVADKLRAWGVLKVKLKALPHPGLLDATRSLVSALGDDPQVPIDTDSPYRMLDQATIETMVQTDSIEIGAHTESHAILSLLSPRERRDEIVGSLEWVAQATGRRCELFAYPNGDVHDYDADTLQVLEAHDVRVSVTAVPGLNHPETPPLELRRFAVGPTWSLDQFASIVHGGAIPPRPPLTV